MSIFAESVYHRVGNVNDVEFDSVVLAENGDLDSATPKMTIMLTLHRAKETPESHQLLSCIIQAQYSALSRPKMPEL